MVFVKNEVKARQFRSKDDWVDLLRDWRESGLSALSWCRVKGISTSVFARWRRKLEGHDSLGQMRSARPFIPVGLESLGLSSSPQLDIVLCSGHRVQVQGLNDQQVLALIQQLVI
jgi:hypothetical protein